MNKHIIPMLALLAGVTAFSSCADQLDIEQKGTKTTDSFYKNDADCEKALAYAYEGFMVNTVGRTTAQGGPGIYTPAKVLANHPGDDVLYASGNYGDHEFGGAIDQFRYESNPEAINFHYRGLYLSVYSDNLVLDHFKDPQTAYQKQAVAEARVLRAYNYFLLACYWGQPPFVDHVLNASDIPTNSDMTQEQYYEWVAKECQDAEPDLIERKSTADKEGAYRVTKGFAHALAGKALLFAKKYDEAKAEFKKVIDSGKYALVPGDQFLDMFHVEGDGNPEKIFELNLYYNAAAGAWSTGSGLGYMNHSTWMEANAFNWRAGNFVTNPARVYTGIDGWGSIGIPEWYGEEFHENDGDSYRFKATMLPIDDVIYHKTGIKGMDYANDELNKMSPEELEKSDKVGINNVTQGLYGESFYLPFKMLIRANDTNDGGRTGDNQRMNNIIVMRYAEVLLDYAECCLQTGDNAEAKKYVNMIQRRAGSKTISDNVDMEVLKREKSYEMWFEGCRFQDILRWNDAKGLARLKESGKQVPHLFDKMFRAPKATDENIVWEHGNEANSRFYITHTHEAEDAGFTVGFQEKNRLFPYPSSVVEMNPNIKQNTGY
ncbi:MAG: RagB/SusD family nutrient uptake outer membrane protein [Prevotella sp.]